MSGNVRIERSLRERQLAAQVEVRGRELNGRPVSDSLRRFSEGKTDTVEER